MKNFNQFKRVFVFVILLALSFGCAPKTLKDLRENYSGKYILEVDGDYQPIYEKILINAKDNYQMSSFIMMRLVEGSLSIDNKKGNVSIVSYGDGAQYWAAIDIEQIEINKTKITIYYALNPWRDIVQKVKDWIK